ncbi:MAG: glycosyltransferase, partial [Phycisphaeraceae bacterium]|nr:glycosyltransferase [Phycisphaeraceae bacterium]
TAAARALLTGQAITPAAMYDRGLAQQLIQWHQRKPFDSVLTYCTGMVGYTNRLLEMPNPPRHVLDMVDVDSQKWAGFAETTRGPMRLVYQAEARRLRAVEAGGVVPFDVVTVISDAEAQRYREHVTDRHEPVVVGNGVDLQRFTPGTPTHEPVIIFTGVMSYKPNIDAAAWFARQVMPRILAAVPDARFDIVGKSPAREVRALGELPGVRVVGPVEDTAESLRAAAVAVAPMRIAPGVQNKVLEAMACGLPTVCSPAAASGIDAAPGEHLLVGEAAAEVAAQCVRMLLNPNERARIGINARYRVQQRYDWEAATVPMLDLLQPEQALTGHES